MELRATGRTVAAEIAARATSTQQYLAVLSPVKISALSLLCVCVCVRVCATSLETHVVRSR